MARRRSGRTNLKKPASAFAPAQDGSGKTIAWKSLAVNLAPSSLDVAFPTVASVVAGQTLRFRTLIPENVTKGTVTLERIRGQTLVWWLGLIIDGAGEFPQVVVPMNIQLVPVQNEVVALDSVLNPRNAADLESNRIIWRRNYYPNLSTVDGTNIDGARRFDCRPMTEEIDIKSRRRFDRATWALIMAVSYATVQEVDVDAAIDLRALFRTSDGL